MVIVSILATPVLAKTDPLSTPFDLSINGESKEVTLAQLGINAEKRTEFSFFEKMMSRIILFRPFYSPSEYSFSWDGEISENLIRAQWGLNSPKDASLTYADGELSLNNAVAGLDLSVDKLLNSLSKAKPKDFQFEALQASVLSTETFTPHLEQVDSLLDNGLQVSEHNFPIQLKDIVIGEELSLTEPYLDYVTKTLEELMNIPAEDIILLEVDPSKTSKVVSEGHLKDGQQLLAEATKTDINRVIANGDTGATAHTEILLGQLINKTGHDLGPLDLISQGLSNFEGSIPGRDFNVRKGLNDHINSIIIPPGAEYSFNSFLDGPVSYNNGWKGAYAIFGGANLELVPGGGICQTSTTVYRAALNAGLELLDFRAHSLYVDYYEDYGNGLDATIFPGVQDLVFKNNTPNYIFVEAYDDGFDAYVNFYGEDDGRIVTLEGPYTTNNQTDKVFEALGRYIRYYEIAWKYTIEWPDGTVDEEWMLNTYNSGVKQNNEEVF